MTRKLHFFLWVLSLPFLFCLCQKRDLPADILAQVGGRYITVEEFVQRAELSPPPAFRNVNGFSGNRGLLELLIGEKVLANEAERLRLNRDEAFKQWCQYTENLAIAKQLYREEVLQRVDLRESEIDSACARAQTSLQIKFFQSPHRAEAESFVALMQNNVSFDEAMRSFSRATPAAENYTSKFTFGDADEALENAVFALSVGQTSQVIATARGFFVVQVQEANRHPAFSQGTNAQQRATVQKTLRARKADRLSAQFVQQFMQEQNVVLRGRSFAVLTKALARRIDFETPAAMPALQQLAEIDYERAAQELNEHLDEALIVFAGGQWSVRQTLEKLRLRQLPFNQQSPQAMRKTLESDLQTLVRDEFLAAEGRRRGLSKHPAVCAEVRMWIDHHLYTRMVQRLGLRPQTGESLHFPPAVVRLQQNDRAVVNERELQTVELTGIAMMAVHPGRPHQLAVPLWPLF